MCVVRARVRMHSVTWPMISESNADFHFRTRQRRCSVAESRVGVPFQGDASRDDGLNACTSVRNRMIHLASGYALAHGCIVWSTLGHDIQPVGRKPSRLPQNSNNESKHEQCMHTQGLGGQWEDVPAQHKYRVPFCHLVLVEFSVLEQTGTTNWTRSMNSKQPCPEVSIKLIRQCASYQFPER